MLRTWYKPVILFLRVLGIQPASANTVGSLCFNESKAKDFGKCTRSCVDVECISRKTQQGIGARSRENSLGSVRSRSVRSLLASSLQRTFNAAVAVELGNRLESGHPITAGREQQ